MKLNLTPFFKPLSLDELEINSKDEEKFIINELNKMIKECEQSEDNEVKLS